MINIGIIGAGYWGPNLIRNFSSLENCHVKYVADLREARLEFVNNNFPDIHTTTDFQTIFDDQEIDAVVIATPVSTHLELGKKALEANKHVFIEKPFTTSVKEAEILVQLASEKDLRIMVGHLFEYHPAVIKIKEILDEGGIGDVYYIDIARLNLGPPETNANVIWDLAPHDISILLYLLGEIPNKVVGVGRSFRNDQWKNLIQASYITMEFPSGKFAQIHNSWLTPNKTRRLEIFGSKGVLVYDEMAVNKLALFGEGIDLRLSGGSNTANNLNYSAGDISYPEIPNIEPLKNECNHFIECIVNNQTPKSDGVSGLNVVRIIESACNSINSKKWTLQTACPQQAGTVV